MGITRRETQIIGDQGRTTVQALYHRGAGATFLRKDLAQGVSNIGRTPIPLRFTLADGKGTLQMEETVNIDISVGDIPVFFTVFVVEGLGEEMIIDVDMMQPWKIQLDPGNEEITMDPDAVRLRL